MLTSKQFANVFQTKPKLVYNYVPLILHAWIEEGNLAGNVLEVVALSLVWQMGYSP